MFETVGLTRFFWGVLAALMLFAASLFAPVRRLAAARPQFQAQTPGQQGGGIGMPGQKPGTPGSLEQEESIPPPLPLDINPHLSQKQKDALVKASFRSTQRDVEKLNKLVQSLSAEIKKSNANVLSLGIVNQAEKIEKLAKKIKNEAKSY
jgi:hypothetical protein